MLCSYYSAMFTITLQFSSSARNIALAHSTSCSRASKDATDQYRGTAALLSVCCGTFTVPCLQSMSCDSHPKPNILPSNLDQNHRPNCSRTYQDDTYQWCQTTSHIFTLSDNFGHLMVFRVIQYQDIP